MNLVIGSACYDMHQRLNEYKFTKKIVSVTQFKEGDFVYFKKQLHKVFKCYTSKDNFYLAVTSKNLNVWSARDSLLQCI